jgi:hypothetical protein
VTQDEFEAQFENKYSGQPEVQDYMLEELKEIHHLFKTKGLRAHSSEITVFWESYSQSMDGNWLSASPERIQKEVEDFVTDPSEWWGRHPHSGR